jgi:hypothetical protein
MSHEGLVPRIRYCRHHHMVWHPRARRWKAVPDDFIPELLHTDLPVDVVARKCPRCDKPTPPTIL